MIGPVGQDLVSAMVSEDMELGVADRSVKRSMCHEGLNFVVAK